MGGFCSFFIESKFFQLVVEEGGRYFLLGILERGKYFMRSVIMGKNAAQWLMNNIEHIVVGVNSKQFFTFRDGDIVYTLQRSTNSFGQFFLLIELKVGEARLIIIPKGKEKNGWRAFVLELRKMLNPSQYAGGTGHPKFFPQAHRHNLEAQNSRSFADAVKGYHGRVEDRQQLKQLGTTVEGKMTQFGEEKMVVKRVVNPRFTGAKEGGGDFPVGKPEKMREQCINVESEFGEQNPEEIRICFPSNSKAIEHGKKCDVSRPCWTGSGLIVEVDGKGRRRVSWDRKRGAQMFKWVPRAGKILCKGKLGLGPNKLVAQLLVSKSTVGLNLTSPTTLELGECSVPCGENLFSTNTHEKDEESPWVSTKCSVMPTQVAGGPVRSSAVWVQAEMGGSSFLVLPEPLMSPVSPLHLECSTRLKVVLPVGVTQCCVSPIGVSGCSKSPSLMVFRLTSDWNSILGSNSLSGGLISEDLRTVTLELVPRSFGPSFPELFLELVRAGSLGLGVLGQVVNSSYSKELFCLPREAMPLEEVADFSVGIGETDLSVGFPLQVIALSVLTNLAELEEVNEVLSIETKLDIFGWVKHRIPGFSKLVGLSLTRHEKLCIALLQRLESVMEAANVLHRKATDSKKVAKSKNKGCRELQNLISSVNYDRR